ncbi:MAG TPA: SIS domain-containing protein [Spirochaetia bacterium]|nr:SIS domain-containing protein [Spirochaetales bacterium]HRY80892.1 SIS domain-containing protein [Spirochaetia bacterium]HRZ90335.1 SIS domain-containing protein [Spirochaetia bacterium]
MTEAEGHIAGLLARRPELAGAESAIRALADLLTGCLRDGGTVLACGNGGSAADADHVACELAKGFLLSRPLPGPLRDSIEGNLERALGRTGAGLAGRLQVPLRAVSLCSNSALLTAIANDQGPDAVFAQQVLGLGRKGDLILCLSTSGKSPSVLAAAAAARSLGLSAALLTGPDAAPPAGLFDVTVPVPGANAGEIQDLHRPVYHAVCAYAEAVLTAVV